jgi:hypothetical protein
MLFIIYYSHFCVWYLQLYTCIKTTCLGCIGLYDIAILLLQLAAHVVVFPMVNGLYTYISTFSSMCTLPSMAVLLLLLLLVVVVVVVVV